MNAVLQQEEPTTNVEFDELEALRARATLMGIKVHPKTGIEMLRNKINAKLSGDKEISTETENISVKVQEKNYLTEKEYKELEFKHRKSNAAKLVRCRVTCMNPNKKEWDGEIISVGSAKLGTFKKFVKFNTEDGWHVPHIIYEYLKDRKCSVFYNEIDRKGQKIRKSKLVNEFNVEVLPPLTKEQLKELAIKQAMESGKEA